FQGFTYCSVFKVRCCLFSTATRLSYHNSLCLSTTFLFSFWKPSKTLSDFPQTSVPLSATRYILSQVLIPVKLIFQFFPFFSFPVIPSIFLLYLLPGFISVYVRNGFIFISFNTFVTVIF
ncbi:UNVERIFIED_ORG: hypothetical protein B5F06_11580, partial [Lacrimispora saccharolytica]